MKSIQTKILFVVIAGLVVITALVSAIAVNMTHTVMHRDADRILQNAAQREAAKINDTSYRAGGGAGYQTGKENGYSTECLDGMSLSTKNNLVMFS